MQSFWKKQDALVSCWKRFRQQLAKEVSESLDIPTIGIGAGKHCDGQVLVMHDMLGINTEFKPRFLRQYLNLHEQVTGAVKTIYRRC